jgi:hypothetical protein
VAAVALGVPSSSISFVALHTRVLGVSEHGLLMGVLNNGYLTGLDTVIPRIIECCMNTGKGLSWRRWAHIYRIVIISTAFSTCALPVSDG